MNKIKNFLKDETGDTNIVSLIILLGVVIGAVVIFRPYIAQLAAWVMGLFS